MLKNLRKFDFQFNCGKEVCDLKNRFVVQLTSLLIRKLIFWHTFALPQCTHSLKSCDVDKKKSSKTENLLAIQRRALEGKRETEAIIRASLTFHRAINYFRFVLKYLTTLFMVWNFVSKHFWNIEFDFHRRAQKEFLISFLLTICCPISVWLNRAILNSFAVL